MAFNPRTFYLHRELLHRTMALMGVSALTAARRIKAITGADRICFYKSPVDPGKPGQPRPRNLG